MRQSSASLLLAAMLVAWPGIYCAPSNQYLGARQALTDGDVPWANISTLLNDNEFQNADPEIVKKLIEIMGQNPDDPADGPRKQLDLTPTSLTLPNGTVISTDRLLNASPLHTRAFGPPGPYPDKVQKHAFPKYVSLGDSYSAGPGAGRGYSPKQSFKPKYSFLGCVQTRPAWPVQLHNYLSEGKQQFKFSACTGFDTTNIVDSSIDGPKAGFPNDPDLVSVTMGGNNGKAFIGVVMGCVVGGYNSKGCHNALHNAEHTFNNIDHEIQRVLIDIMNKNRHRQPTKKRTILVMGYPKPYEDGKKSGNRYCKLPRERRSEINELAERLNIKLIRNSWLVGQQHPDTNVIFMDPNRPDAQSAPRHMPNHLNFDGNRYCNSGHPGSSFFSFLGFPKSIDPVSYLTGFFHPNAAGHAATAAAAQQALFEKFSIK